MRPGRVGVRGAATASSTRAAGDDPVGDPGHLVLDAAQLLPAPGVGLLEVDGGAEEVARAERVALAADGVLVPAPRGAARRRASGRTPRRRRWRRVRVSARARSRAAVDVGRGRPGREEVVAALLPGPAAHLLGDRGRAGAWRTTWPVVGRLRRGSRGSRPAWPGRRPAGRRCWTQASSPSVRHQVEDATRTSCSPLAITETCDCGTRASYSSTSSPSRSRNASWATCSRSSTGVGGRGVARSARRVRPRARRSRRGRGRSAVLVAGEAQEGRGDRVEGGEVVDEPLRDGVDGRAVGGCRRSRRNPSPTPRARPGRPRR